MYFDFGRVPRHLFDLEKFIQSHFNNYLLQIYNNYIKKKQQISQNLQNKQYKSKKKINNFDDIKSMCGYFLLQGIY